MRIESLVISSSKESEFQQEFLIEPAGFLAYDLIYQVAKATNDYSC